MTDIGLLSFFLLLIFAGALITAAILAALPASRGMRADLIVRAGRGESALAYARQIVERHRLSQLERRALLIQMGGYTINGNERIYSAAGQAHVEAVTTRKARQSSVASVAATRLAS